MVNKKIETITNKLKQKLTSSVKRNFAEGMLFSGGLDTGILALLSPNIAAINVSLEDYATDLKFAMILEKFLHLKVYYQTIKIEEAISVIPEIIKVLKSFD
ncbi:MAG: hypothetical protein Q7K21_05955, partial [Elusimicrobiota bacterium]|nr:hypothetical protein [Elusimicrobiota bacterium]